MSRRLEKLIEQKAWETLTDYGYNDAHLLEQLTESVLERFANLDETMIPRAPKSLPPFPNPKFYEPPFTQPSSPFTIPGDPGFFDPENIDPRRRDPQFDPSNPNSPFYEPPPDEPFDPRDPDISDDDPRLSDEEREFRKRLRRLLDNNPYR